MAGYLNVGSLVFGLVAWALPVVSLMKRKAHDWRVYSIASVSACAVALCMQVFYTDHLVKIEDWSALMDTSNAVTRVSAILLAITLMLNAISWALNGRGRK